MQAHSTTPATPLLQVRGLQVRFGAKSVVRGVVSPTVSVTSG